MFVPEWKNYAQAYPNTQGQTSQVTQQGYGAGQQGVQQNVYGQQSNLALPGYNTNTPYGVQQQGQNTLVPGQLNQGVSQTGFGVQGQSQQGFGTQGQVQQGFGAQGQSQQGFGTQGQPQQGFGTQGQAQQGFGTQGLTNQGFGTNNGGGGGGAGQVLTQGNSNQQPQESRWISLSGIPRKF